MCSFVELSGQEEGGQGRARAGTERIGWTGEAVAPHRQCDPDSKNTTPLQPKRSNKAKPKCLNVFYINLILFHLLSSAEATQEGEEQEEKRGGGGRRAAFATRVAVCNLRVKWKKLLANEKSLHCTQVFSINNASFFFFLCSFDPIQLTNCDVIQFVEMCVLWLCFGIEFISNPHRGLAQLS